MDTPLAADARFEAFTCEVKQTHCLWVLRSEVGYAQQSSEDGTTFPVWSQRAMAEEAVTHSFPGYHVEEVALSTFRDSFMPALHEKELWIGVNLTSDMLGIEVPCIQFEREIANEVD